MVMVKIYNVSNLVLLSAQAQILALTSSEEWKQDSVNRDKGGRFSKKDASGGSGGENVVSRQINYIKEKIKSLIPENNADKFEASTKEIAESIDLSKDDPGKDFTDSIWKKLKDLDDAAKDNFVLQVATSLAGIAVGVEMIMLERKYGPGVKLKAIKKIADQMAEQGMASKGVVAKIKSIPDEKLVEHVDSVAEHLVDNSVAKVADNILNVIHKKFPHRPPDVDLFLPTAKRKIAEKMLGEIFAFMQMKQKSL